MPEMARPPTHPELALTYLLSPALGPDFHSSSFLAEGSRRTKVASAVGRGSRGSCVWEPAKAPRSLGYSSPEEIPLTWPHSRKGDFKGILVCPTSVRERWDFPPISPLVICSCVTFLWHNPCL